MFGFSPPVNLLLVVACLACLAGLVQILARIAKRRRETVESESAPLTTSLTRKRAKRSDPR